MISVLVTGASGFIGKNLCSHLDLMEDVEVLRYDKHSPLDDLRSFVEKSDFIFHLAGVNRPENDAEFETGNKDLTEQIISILREKNKTTPLLITSSIQAELDNAYGKSKLAAEQAVFNWHKESNSPVFVYRLPGVFGKWCKPNYNSVVATFCNNIANGLPIQVSDPSHVITLTYIDDVVNSFTSHLQETNPQNYLEYQKVEQTFEISLGELETRIRNLHSIRTNLIIPDLSDLLNKYLYATYTSYINTESFPYDLVKNSDQRGWLAEFVKSPSFGQIFISKTKPGISRGDHWHKTKIEKFLVVEGDAEITFRNKIDNQDVITHRVNGDDMRVLDIPVGYVHAIKNSGTSDLITIFWANEMLNKENPDTFYEKVSEE